MLWIRLIKTHTLGAVLWVCLFTWFLILVQLKLRYIVGFGSVEMAISTDPNPTIYRSLHEKTGPGRFRALRWSYVDDFCWSLLMYLVFCSIWWLIRGAHRQVVRVGASSPPREWSQSGQSLICHVLIIISSSRKMCSVDLPIIAA